MLKNLIFLFGFSTFVTVVWIGTTIFHNSVTSRISESNQLKIAPIDPTFDLETLDSLEARTEIPVSLSDSLSIVETDDDLIEATESGFIEIQITITPTIPQ